MSQKRKGVFFFFYDARFCNLTWSLAHDPINPLLQFAENKCEVESVGKVDKVT